MTQESIALKMLQRKELADNFRLLLHPADQFACGHYRMLQPAQALHKAGGVLPMASFNYVQPQELLEMKPDRIIVQRQYEPTQVAHLKEYKKAQPDVPLILDMDDLVWMPSGSTVARLSKEQLKGFDTVVRMADRVVCSTLPLAKHLRNTYKVSSAVLPNFISGRVYQAPKPRINDRLRVCWAGGGFHKEDLEVLKKVVFGTVDLVDWIFIGDAPKDAEKWAYRVVRDWIPTPKWLDFLSSLYVDVAVAPLRDNAFNRCKSNIKLIEWNAIGVPVIASAVEPYIENKGPLIPTGKNELDHWIESIRTIAGNEQLRMALAMDSFVWASRYNLEGNIDNIRRAWLMPPAPKLQPKLELVPTGESNVH